MWDEFVRGVGSIVIFMIVIGVALIVLFSCYLFIVMRNMDVVPMCKAFPLCDHEMERDDEKKRYGFCIKCFTFLNLKRIDEERERNKNKIN
jgi:hypothetical protein